MLLNYILKEFFYTPQRWVNKQATMHFNNAQTLTPKLERRREHLPKVRISLINQYIFEILLQNSSYFLIFLFKRFETIHSRSHSYDIKDAIQRYDEKLSKK